MSVVQSNQSQKNGPMSTLNQLNRSYARVTPKQPFWDLVKQYTQDAEFQQFHEPTLYLIEEDFWDESTFFEKYFLKIARFEFEQHVDTENMADQLPKNGPQFLELFHIEFGSTIVDLISKPSLSYG